MAVKRPPRTAGRRRKRPASATPARRAPVRAPVSPARLNPDPDEVQRSVVQLVLSLVEFLRELMERQAIRQMEEGVLTEPESESVGLALMRLEDTVRELADRFGIDPAELNLTLGPLGRLR